MENCIKINYLNFDNGEIKAKYFVFSGNISDIRDIFDEDEMNYIKKNKTEINFIKNKFIHLDDTIDTIKRKIMQHVLKVSFEEIYLFGVLEKKINTFTLYKELTQNEKIPLTREGLNQFLRNLMDIDTLPNKEIYDYEDLLTLKLDEKKQKVKIPLGQEFIIDNSYHYTINPFQTTSFSNILQEYAEDFINTASNRSLLFNNGNLFKKTIFLCTASDVLNFAKVNSLPEKLFIKVYFPLLYHHPIPFNSLKNLEDKILILQNDSKKLLDKTYKDINDDVDLFYNIYYLRKRDLKYNFKGIKQINFTIKPTHKILIPLEIIFKLINTSEKNPLIKFNPGNRFENIYRLYANKNSKKGKKIPFLSKNTIGKLRRNIAKRKLVSIYILIETYEIICSFDAKGKIHVDLELNNVLSIEEAEKIIKMAINPIISTIGNFLGQSGYSYITFENLDEPNIHIKNMVYTSSIPITKKFNTKKFEQE